MVVPQGSLLVSLGDEETHGHRSALSVGYDLSPPSFAGLHCGVWDKRAGCMLLLLVFLLRIDLNH